MARPTSGWIFPPHRARACFAAGDVSGQRIAHHGPAEPLFDCIEVVEKYRFETTLSVEDPESQIPSPEKEHGAWDVPPMLIGST
jgi:hypothetical protein